MPWREPITGGDDELTIDKIQSYGFISGSTGWRIERLGDAEFNSLTARGTVKVGPDDGFQIVIEQTAQQGNIFILTHAATESSPGVIAGQIGNEGLANEYTQMILFGPRHSSPGSADDRVFMTFNSQNADATSDANLQIGYYTAQGVFGATIASFEKDLIGFLTDVLIQSSDLTVQGNIQLDGNLNGWAGFTPTWTGSVTNPTLGNGTVSAVYKNIGDLVYFYIKYIFGTTTTFGSGAYGFSLPIAPINDQNVSASYIDVSASARFPGTAWLTNGSGIFRALTSAGGVGISSTVPFTWASGDILLISGSYRSV